MSDSFPAPVQEAIDAGFAVVPADMEKRPKVKWREWTTAPQTDDDRMNFGHGSLWSVITGQNAGVVVLDFDGPEGLETMARLGLKPHVRTAAGAHVYVRHPGHPVKSSAKQFPDLPGLDIKGERSLAYFEGRSKKGRYQPVAWPPTPVALDPGLTERLFPVPTEREPAAPVGTWDGPGAGTESAVHFLTTVCNRIRDAETGSSNAALNKGAYSVGGLVAAGHLDSDVAYEHLLDAARDRGAGSPEDVISAAMETGAEAPWTLDGDDPEWQQVGSATDVLIDPIDGTVWELVVKPLQLSPADIARDERWEIHDALTSRTMGVAEVLRRPPPRWLVPGFLQAASLAELVGPPSAGKSLLALQWAVDIALNGKRVLYAAAEGMAGFGLRLRAVAKQRGVSLDELVDQLDTLRFYTAGMNLGDPASADDLVSWAQKTGPWDLIIVDTLARAVPGVEENSAKEMGAAVHAAERLKTGDGTVLLVHHSGHGTSRGRGSSAVLAACDNVIHCFPTSEAYDGRDGKPLRVKVTTQKLKDGRAGRPMHLRTEEISLGQHDGDLMTSVVLVPVSEAEEAAERAEDRLAEIETKVRDKIDAGIPWDTARNSWKGEDRRQAKLLWGRLSQ